MKQKLILSLFAAAALAASAQSQGYKDGIEYYNAGQFENAKTILNNTLNNPGTDKSLALYFLGQIALAQDDKRPKTSSRKVSQPTKNAATTM